MEDDECIRNPEKCPKGLSFSLFYFPDYKEKDSELAIPNADFETEVIISSGGDRKTPGFSIYRQGGTFGAMISTGNFTWVLEVVGGIPNRNKWSNIAVRWRPLNFKTKEEFDNRTKNGERDEDFGGLTVFIDLKKIGKVQKNIEFVVFAENIRQL